MWEVNSIDPSEEIIEGSQSSSILRLGINFKSKMVHSSSAVSIDQDDILTDYSSGKFFLNKYLCWIKNGIICFCIV